MSEKKVCFKNLSKKEKAHLKEMGCNTFSAFKETAQYQAKLRREHTETSYNYEPCYDCKHIALKLGLEV